MYIHTTLSRSELGLKLGLAILYLGMVLRAKGYDRSGNQKKFKQ